MKRPTIKDIARLAGVTPATVSMALNGNGRISTRTRERVLEIARNLDYRPNPLARGLVARRTHLIGVVIVEVAVSFFKDILRGMEDALQPHGYGLILNVTNGDPKREEKFVQFHNDKRVDGLILEPTAKFQNRTLLEEMVKSGLPVLTILHSTYGWGNSLIAVNNDLGAKLATTLLLEGCKRIARIKGPSEAIEAAARQRGHRRTLREAGIEADPKLEGQNESGWYTPEEGYAQMKRLLATCGAPPDGVFADSDSLAYGAIQAMNEGGLNVPGDVEVVGFDDVEIATLSRPTLTTVAQPKYQLGYQAGQMILQLINDKTPTREVLKPHLVVRDSTRPRVKSSSTTGKV